MFLVNCGIHETYGLGLTAYQFQLYSSALKYGVWRPRMELWCSCWIATPIPSAKIKRSRQKDGTAGQMKGDNCTNRTACAWDMAFGGQIIYGILIVCGKPSWKTHPRAWEERAGELKKKRISFDVSYTNAAQSEQFCANSVVVVQCVP